MRLAAAVQGGGAAGVGAKFRGWWSGLDSSLTGWVRDGAVTDQSADLLDKIFARVGDSNSGGTGEGATATVAGQGRG